MLGVAKNVAGLQTLCLLDGEQGQPKKKIAAWLSITPKEYVNVNCLVKTGRNHLPFHIKIASRSQNVILVFTSTYLPNINVLVQIIQVL